LAPPITQSSREFQFGLLPQGGAAALAFQRQAVGSFPFTKESVELDNQQHYPPAHPRQEDDSFGLPHPDAKFVERWDRLGSEEGGNVFVWVWADDRGRRHECPAIPLQDLSPRAYDAFWRHVDGQSSPASTLRQSATVPAQRGRARG